MALISLGKIVGTPDALHFVNKFALSLCRLRGSTKAVTG